MSVEQSTLNAFMDAVTNYYGGADIWSGITDTGAFTSADFAAKVTQVDGVSAVYNSAGDVLYYKYNDQIVANSLDLSNTINSNVGSTINSSSVNLPANTSIGAGSTVEATSGMVTTGSTTVATVVKDVALGVAAVGAGIQLGAAIDGALYNLNPDFWDANNMSALNPQTWDTLVSDYGEPAQQVFNMVFGIDKNTNKVQPYLDERALAYIAQYLTYQGVFSTSGATWDGVKPEPNWVAVNPIIKGTETFQGDLGTGGIVTCYYLGRVESATSPYIIGVKLNTNNNDFVVTSATNGTSLKMWFTSKTPFTCTVHFFDDNYYGRGSTSVMGSTDWTYNGQTVYLNTFEWGSFSGNYVGLGTNLTNFNTYSGIMQTAWLLQYGDFVGGGVDGITTQDGAIIPAGITPQMSIDDVLTQLRLLYPDLFNSKITNDVVQPDGTITTYTYVPVAIPENVPLDDVTNALKPTGGVELTQGNTSIDPTITPDSVLETLLKIIGSVDPNIPTQPLNDTPTDYPDTGDGTTPAIILPDGQASALYSIYNPSQAQINALGAWLWSSNFVDQLLKLFNDPMQAIIGLHKIFATPPTSGTGNIKVGYLDSGVSAKLVSAQYTEVDCGTVSLSEYFGNVLDYTDTDIYLYLPFVGIVPVSALDVIRSTINIKYKVDVLTGACMAQVYVNRDNNAGGQLYCYAGDCAVKYPLSSGSYMGIVSSVIGIAGSVAGTIASGGAMLPLALGAGASALNGARTRVEHSGQLTGNAGAMGIKKPYFIIRRPQTKFANNFQNYNGQSNNIFVNLGSCAGYTRVRFLHLENIPATGDELAEIENILKSGVII